MICKISLAVAVSRVLIIYLVYLLSFDNRNFSYRRIVDERGVDIEFVLYYFPPPPFK